MYFVVWVGNVLKVLVLTRALSCSSKFAVDCIPMDLGLMLQT